MPNPPPTRVLVCEDDLIGCEIVAAFLSEAGYDVRVCHDGKSALRLAAAWNPAAAVIDIELPCISGYAVGQQLRDQFGADILLVALTGHDTPDEIAKAGYAGFDWHFSKPARPVQVLEVLRNPGQIPVAVDGVRLTPRYRTSAPSVA